MPQIDGKLLISRVKPNQQLSDLLISLGLNTDRYSEVSSPVFQIFYLDGPNSSLQLHTYTCYVDPYNLNNNLKQIEYENDIIYIFPPYDYPTNHLRLCPVCNSDEYKRRMRQNKLERILQDETEEI